MSKQELGQGVWYSPDKKGYIGLDLTDQIPPQEALVVDGQRLLPKNEFHCSILALRRYVEDRERERQIADEIKGFLNEHDLYFGGLGDERYVCRKEDRMTVIAPVDIKGIADFQRLIKSHIPEYKPPFLHVTLLKSEATELGIGINSEDDFMQYCERLVA